MVLQHRNSAHGTVPTSRKPSLPPKSANAKSVLRVQSLAHTSSCILPGIEPALPSFRHFRCLAVARESIRMLTRRRKIQSISTALTRYETSAAISRIAFVTLPRFVSAYGFKTSSSKGTNLASKSLVSAVDRFLDPAGLPPRLPLCLFFECAISYCSWVCFAVGHQYGLISSHGMLRVNLSVARFSASALLSSFITL